MTRFLVLTARIWWLRSKIAVRETYVAIVCWLTGRDFEAIKREGYRIG
jgi:hypothetical protein